MFDHSPSVGNTTANTQIPSGIHVFGSPNPWYDNSANSIGFDFTTPPVQQRGCGEADNVSVTFGMVGVHLELVRKNTTLSGNEAIGDRASRRTARRSSLNMTPLRRSLNTEG